MSSKSESSKELQDGQSTTAESAAQTPEANSAAEKIVTGTVSAVEEKRILVDIDSAAGAVLPAADILSGEDAPGVSTGDSLKCMVLSDSENGTVLSASMPERKKAGMKLLRALKELQLPVTGRISGMNKGGYNISFLGRKAFCPFSTVDISFPDNPQELMGREYDFVIARIENRGDNIVLTRIPLLQDQIDETLTKIEAAKESGEPMNGKVTRVTHFGAFVDLGGIEGLVHVSELTWDRDEKTESVVKEGENIAVLVLDVQRNEQLHESRISLSLKRLSKDPWEEALQKFSVGDTVEGTVSRIVGFGAFIRLMPGVEALIRTEEMAWTRVRKPSRHVSRNQTVKARIIHIDEEGHKIDCSLKDFVENPWEKLQERVAEGDTVKGVVSGVQEYGYFVDLDEEITGLLRTKRIGKDVQTPLEKGAEIDVAVDEIDPVGQRIALSCGDVPPAPAPRPASFKGRSASTKSEKTGGTDFGSALMDALKKKK
ncbi:MAG: S1 RNA-binding domain-containing protein [Fibrobacterota bacterium]